MRKQTPCSLSTTKEVINRIYQSGDQGIPKGDVFSVVIGALYLIDLDYFIEKAQKEFYFLGYTKESELHSVSLSESTLQRFRQRLHSLYEHRASKERVAMVKTRWTRCATSGWRDLNVKIPRAILILIQAICNGGRSTLTRRAVY
jgi:hypothetical protein